MLRGLNIVFLLAFVGNHYCIANSRAYTLPDSIHIPLEVYSGFQGDSIKLPGDSLAQPVYIFGQYHSKVKVKLEDVGDVYVHRVVYFEADYSTMEVYSRKPNREFIHGIKRVGQFRLYEHQNSITDSTYSGAPKIEFVECLNSVLSTVYPLSVFSIGSGNEIKISGEKNDPNSVEVAVKDIKGYVDPILYDSLTKLDIGPQWGFRGWIQNNIANCILTVNLHLYGWEELGTFESIIFDSLGNQIGHIHDYGALTSTTLSANHMLLYVNTGGALTEDYEAPYVFRIYDLHTGKAIFIRRSTLYQIAGGAISHTNFGVLKIKTLGGQYPDLETYVIDHEKNLMYALHKHPKCQHPCSAIFFPDYFECRMSNGTKTQFRYTDDFDSEPFPE